MPQGPNPFPTSALYSKRRWIRMMNQRGVIRPGTRALPDALRVTARDAAVPPGAAVLTSPLVHFSEDPNSIVTVTVTTVQAPTPNTYQQCGCLVSFGATTLPVQSAAELTADMDLAGITLGPAAVTGIAWAASVGTVTAKDPLPATWTVGDNPTVVLAGFVPAGYDGIYTATIIDATTFSIPLPTNPGPVTTPGTYQPGSSIELGQMATTFFSQGNAVGCWVLELGEGLDVTANAAALQTWLTNNPRSFYGYLMPRKFGADTAGITALEAVLKQYQSPEAMTYFWLTVVPATMDILGPTYKDVIQMVEAPVNTQAPNNTLANGEFSQAAMFYNAMAYRPAPGNLIAPMAFKYLYGVTTYPVKGNGPLLQSFKQNNTNYVAYGAEGGIDFNMVYEGVTLDGYDYFNWWYTIDYAQININLNLSNAIINGSNNPLAPLYYDQLGINRLLGVLYNTMQQMRVIGMVLGIVTMTEYTSDDLQAAIAAEKFAGQCDCNAIPFLDYTLANPGDYKIGEYDGLSTLFIPRRGFIHILVNVVASSLVSV